MRSRSLRFILLALAAAAALPLAGDAAIPVPAFSQAACCNVADAVPPPTPTGDEQFFKIPGGVPNVMLVIDTSGSMFGLPRDVTYPTWSSTNNTFRGSCDAAHTWLASVTPVDPVSGAPDTTRAPYDNGYNIGTGAETIDNPPWGLTRCEAKQARPAGNAATDYCLFRPDSYYKGVGDLGSASGWDSSKATVYNANPCAAITGNNGAPFTNYLGAMVEANDKAQCESCLATKGFYIMNPRYERSFAGDWRTAGNQVVFAGWFLNANPPKYVAARKVVKDLVRLDATPRASTDQVRFGLTVFTTSSNAYGYKTQLQAGDGGKLVVPLGPNCDQSFPVDRPAFATTRQVLVDAVNATTTTTDWSDTKYVNFGNATPLAETLFNVGQYFSTKGATNYYAKTFNTATATWTRSTFEEDQSGAVGALATWTGAGKNQKSFCWACQQSSAIVVTDGAPNSDSNLPASPTPGSSHSTFLTSGGIADFRRWSNATVDCATCGNDICSSSCGGTVPNAMHKVAYFLSQTDLRSELDNTARPQTVATYTISFGIPATDTAAIALLNKTATLGGGIFANTSSGEELAAALNVAVSDVVSRATSFSSANASSLQTSKSTSADAYLGRFRPMNAPAWEGHLFAAMLFDEFAQGCDARFGAAGQKPVECGLLDDGTKPLKNPNLNEDEADGKAICSSTFLVDRECDPIIEDAAGNFKKGHFDATTHQVVGDPDDATLFWDAGRVLSYPTLPDGVTANPAYRSADEDSDQKRSIWTVIDVDANGRFDGPSATRPKGELVEFLAANAAALAPLMDLPAVAQASNAALPAGAKWCNTWLNSIGVCGLSPLPSCGNSIAAVQTKCAENVIHFYRGWDVMDWDGDHCAGPGHHYNGANGWGTCTADSQCGAEAKCQLVGAVRKCVNQNCSAKGEQRDRPRDSRSLASQEFWKLGDIFHSSPVLVKPPIGKFSCDLAADNQCVLTLYSGVGMQPTIVTPIELTGGVDAYEVWRTSQLDRKQTVVVGANDGMLHAFDAGDPDPTGTADFEGKPAYTSGDGEELWAFVPPDILPRLRKGLESHTYSVDGNTMVRDVWVDLNDDGKKQSTEFRTVAVITERGGGSRWTALDITDTDQPPVFLWTFPELCTEDSKLAGQSWSDFLPRPPPIGPVRLKPLVATRDPLGRGFEERWVVMLNGGYDPALVRGRIVWMLDVWTGKVVWRYRDSDFKTMRGDVAASMLPVAASIAMSDIGEADQPSGTPQSDTYFDTATWTDVGGNLFVARMHQIGLVDAATGLVTNWTAARAFEPNRQATDAHLATGRGESFFMTGNVLDRQMRLVSTFGTGHRDNLMQKTPACGPSNLSGCCASGCTVTTGVSSSTYGGGSCTQGGTFQCSGGTLSYTPSATSGCGTQATPHACTAFSSSVTLTFNCGAAGSMGPMTAQLTCGSDGACTTNTPFTTTSSRDTTALGKGLTQYRFNSVWAYGRTSSKRFVDSASAKLFEAERFTDVPFVKDGKSYTLVETSAAQLKDNGDGKGLVLTCRGGATKCKAEPEDPGWMYTYGKWCPAKLCSDTTWLDERTGGASFPFMGCVTWSTFRPTGAVGGTDPCSASADNPTAFAYLLNMETGQPDSTCGFKDVTPLAYYGATVRDASAPPQNPSMRIGVNERGQVNYSTLRIETGSGASKTDLGTRQNVGEMLYWLEVPREVHTCRHVDPNTCK